MFESVVIWIATNTATAIFLGLVGIAALWAFGRYFWPLFRRGSAFRQARKSIEERGSDSLPTAPFPSSHSWLNERWRQYVTSHREESVEVEGRVLTTASPADFFPPSTVLRGHNRNAAIAIGGIFLALGILGTFWGLVLGLRGVDTSTSERLLTSVTSLLSGMSTAFWSSIFGITASILWLLADKWAYNRLRSEVAAFVEAVASRWPAADPDRALLQTLALQAEQKAILQNLGTDLGQAFERAIYKSFTQELSPALSSIDETLERVASQVSDEQAEALDEMATAFRDRLLGSVQQQFDELGSAIQEATEWQRRVSQDVGSLFEQVSELSRANAELLENSSEAAEKFLASLDGLADSQTRIAETAESLEGVAGQTATLSKQLQGQNEVFLDANDTIRKQLAEQLDLVEDQVSSLSGFWKEVHGDLDNLATRLSESLSEFTSVTDEKLGQVFHRFDSEMGKVVEHLSGTLLELREVTEDLAPTIERVEQALEETLEPLEASKDDLGALTHSIRSLEELPERLMSASREMETARDALAELSGHVESLNETLGDGAGGSARASSGDDPEDSSDGDGDSGSGFGFLRGR